MSDRRLHNQSRTRPNLDLIRHKRIALALVAALMLGTILLMMPGSRQGRKETGWPVWGGPHVQVVGHYIPRAEVRAGGVLVGTDATTGLRLDEAGVAAVQGWLMPSSGETWDYVQATAEVGALLDTGGRGAFAPVSAGDRVVVVDRSSDPLTACESSEGLEITSFSGRQVWLKYPNGELGLVTVPVKDGAAVPVSFEPGGDISYLVFCGNQIWLSRTGDCVDPAKTPVEGFFDNLSATFGSPRKKAPPTPGTTSLGSERSVILGVPLLGQHREEFVSLGDAPPIASFARASDGASARERGYTVTQGRAGGLEFFGAGLLRRAFRPSLEVRRVGPFDRPPERSVVLCPGTADLTARQPIRVGERRSLAMGDVVGFGRTHYRFEVHPEELALIPTLKQNRFYVFDSISSGRLESYNRRQPVPWCSEDPERAPLQVVAATDWRAVHRRGIPPGRSDLHELFAPGSGGQRWPVPAPYWYAELIWDRLAASPWRSESFEAPLAEFCFDGSALRVTASESIPNNLPLDFTPLTGGKGWEVGLEEAAFHAGDGERFRLGGAIIQFRTGLPVYEQAIPVVLLAGLLFVIASRSLGYVFSLVGQIRGQGHSYGLRIALASALTIGLMFSLTLAGCIYLAHLGAVDRLLGKMDYLHRQVAFSAAGGLAVLAILGLFTNRGHGYRPEELAGLRALGSLARNLSADILFAVSAFGVCLVIDQAMWRTLVAQDSWGSSPAILAMPDRVLWVLIPAVLLMALMVRYHSQGLALMSRVWSANPSSQRLVRLAAEIGNYDLRSSNRQDVIADPNGRVLAKTFGLGVGRWLSLTYVTPFTLQILGLFSVALGLAGLGNGWADGPGGLFSLLPACVLITAAAALWHRTSGESGYVQKWVVSLLGVSAFLASLLLLLWESSFLWSPSSIAEALTVTFLRLLVVAGLAAATVGAARRLGRGWGVFVSLSSLGAWVASERFFGQPVASAVLMTAGIFLPVLRPALMLIGVSGTDQGDQSRDRRAIRSVIASPYPALTVKSIQHWQYLIALGVASLAIGLVFGSGRQGLSFKPAEFAVWFLTPGLAAAMSIFFGAREGLGTDRLARRLIPVSILMLPAAVAALLLAAGGGLSWVTAMVVLLPALVLLPLLPAQVRALAGRLAARGSAPASGLPNPEVSGHGLSWLEQLGAYLDQVRVLTWLVLGFLVVEGVIVVLYVAVGDFGPLMVLVPSHLLVVLLWAAIPGADAGPGLSRGVRYTIVVMLCFTMAWGFAAGYALVQQPGLQLLPEIGAAVSRAAERFETFFETWYTVGGEWTTQALWVGAGFYSAQESWVSNLHSDLALLGVVQSFGAWRAGLVLLAFLVMAGALVLIPDLLVPAAERAAAHPEAPADSPRMLREAGFVGALTAAYLLAEVATHSLTCLNLIPQTGLTLPWISQGGSALIAFSGLVAVALGVSVSRFYGIARELQEGQQR